MSDDTTREKNKAVARSLLDAWNQQRQSYLPPDLISPTLVTHFPRPRGRAIRGRSWRSASEVVLPREAFPDQHYEEQILIADDQFVFHAWDVTGTNTGPIYGRPATGKEVTVQGAHVLRLADDRIVELWDYYPKVRLHALARLGLLDSKMQEYLMTAGLIGRGRPAGRL